MTLFRSTRSESPMHSGLPFKRPNPLIGDPGSKQYADHYIATHLSIPDFWAYKNGYLDIVVVDSLFREYTMLDVGCGTGGYYQLLKNYKHITGWDFSHYMIEAALKLKTDLSLCNVDFVCARFEEFESNQKFDIVRVPGVFGTYMPWTLQALSKVCGLLNDGGVAVVSIFPPNSAITWVKYLVHGKNSKLD